MITKIGIHLSTFFSHSHKHIKKGSNNNINKPQQDVMIRPCHGSSSHQPLIIKALVPFKGSSHRICGRQSGNGTGFFPNTSIFPCP